ncbi:hypothetical protein FOA52_015342 [Chlamydomonas sp. UWO 241]|nr:hypothetical protein FOA52_015342 [Chlamydomonas sp. UWO 241]
MWAPCAKYKFTLVWLTSVKQVEASDSCFRGYTSRFTQEETGRGSHKFLELSALRPEGGGRLVDDALVQTVDVTVEREDWFQPDAGGIPCDVALKLPCGAELTAFSPLLQAASPFFRDALEDVQGGAPIPVDGSLGTWTYILMDLHPLHDPPALTLGSDYALLPVVHKYDFTKLLKKLVAFVWEKSEALSHNPVCCHTYIMRWLALAERLQLDEVRELCLGRLR